MLKKDNRMCGLITFCCWVVLLLTDNVISVVSSGCDAHVLAVTTCPRDSKERNKSSVHFNCSCADNGNGVYHCVADKDQKIMFEVCSKPILANQGGCIYYDRQGKRLQESYSRSCRTGNSSPKCPLVYNSTEIFKYKQCYPEIPPSRGKKLFCVSISVIFLAGMGVMFF